QSTARRLVGVVPSWKGRGCGPDGLRSRALQTRGRVVNRRTIRGAGRKNRSQWSDSLGNTGSFTGKIQRAVRMVWPASAIGRAHRGVRGKAWRKMTKNRPAGGA